MSNFEQPAPPAKPRKSWFGRNWWWVLLLIILGGGLVCAGVCAGIVSFGLQKVRESEPYTMTLDAVQNDPVVVERLGKPIQDSWQINMQGDISGNQGSVRITVPITGPKGSATVSSQSQCINGNWGLTSVDVTFANGERHSLEITPEQAGGQSNIAPPFNSVSPPGEVGRDQMPQEEN